jgi:hypothetical protein
MGRRIAVGLLTALALIVGGASGASACTTDEWVTLGSATAGPTEPVAVRGGGFEPGAVHLRWNGMAGDSLGTATVGADGRFSATVEVPSGVGAGRYSVAAVQDPVEGRTLRGWAYADVVVPTPPPPPQSAPPVRLAAAALLLAVGVGAGALPWHRRRARTAALDAEVARLLEDAEVPAALR